MNIGDYVRTKDGIAKITSIDVMEKVAYTDNKDIVFGIEEQRCYEITQYAKPGSYVDSYYIPQDKVYILNYSPNIIDLIEVGDYVNGSKVLDIAQTPKKAIYTEQENGGALLPIINNRIESVLTKEQFESMEYKVKD